MTKRFACAFVGLLLICTVYGAQQVSTSHQDCDAPSYFGICDPYVPGTIIASSPDMKTINVINTWPDGPAEKSGVCPGDQIIAVNGILVPGHTWEQMLKEIVSPSPSPIDLKVTRGKQEMDFHFDRARESTLAQLSHKKFMRRRVKEILDATPYQSLSSYPNPTKAEPPVLGILLLYAENPREAMVDQVDYPSPAFDAGLHVGDRILAVNAVPIEQITRQQLGEMLQPKGDSELRLEVSRVGKKLAFQIKPETYAEAEAKIGRKIIKQRPVPEHCPES
jgi:C-terminal processing protease CtpA/Prc